jgi:hypothetical protein
MNEYKLGNFRFKFRLRMTMNKKKGIESACRPSSAIDMNAWFVWSIEASREVDIIQSNQNNGN